MNTDGADAILSLHGVRYRYAGATRWVVADIDLEIHPGESVGLVGPNDAGKSTLCLVASGIAPASIGGTLEGAASLGAQETRRLRPFEAAQRAGILFQNPRTQLSGTAPTVFEEVAFGPRNLGVPLHELVARVWATLETLRIADIADRDPHRLSGGQAQLVALASVLALQPPLLVLDEPTSQLDPAGTRLVADALASIAQTGTALLIVEHKTDVLERICRRLLAIDGGRIVLDSPTAAAFEDPVLESIGVEPPARFRIAAALRARGMAMPRLSELPALAAGESR